MSSRRYGRRESYWIAVVALLAMYGAAAALFWLQTRVPSALALALLSRPDGIGGAELNAEAAASLRSYVQRCSHLGLYDAPLLGIERATNPSAGLRAGSTVDPTNAAAEAVDHQGSEAAIALYAHDMVLRENGGEWKSDLHAHRIRRILNSLTTVLNDRTCVYKITMLDTPQINAVSTADGRIYLTQGLVTTSTDDELAMVIAHEMSHIIAGDWINWWALSAGGDAHGDADSAGDTGSGMLHGAEQALAEAGVTALAGAATTSYAQEHKADARAVLLAVLGGYEGARAYRSLTRLPQMPVTSHPSVSDRIAGARQVMSAMENPRWSNSFNPVKVAREWVMAAVDRRAQGGVAADDSNGLDDVAKACISVLDTISATEKDMRAARWPGSSWPYGMRGAIVGRAALLTESVAGVDIAVDTAFGYCSAGTPGVICGRVWLVRQNGIWTPVVAQVLPSGRTIAPEWKQVPDEMRCRARRHAAVNSDSSNGVTADCRGSQPSAEHDVIAVAEKWCDTIVGDSLEDHIDLYSRGRLGPWPLPEKAGPGANEIGGAMEAIGRARFLAGKRATHTVWDVRCEIHSPTLATVTFTSALSLGELPISSGAIRLTLVQEDGEWRIAGVRFS